MVSSINKDELNEWLHVLANIMWEKSCKPLLQIHQLVKLPNRNVDKNEIERLQSPCRYYVKKKGKSTFCWK